MKYWPWYVALGIVSFIVVAGGIVGSRLSEQTLAFMAGVIFGGFAALPIGAVIGWAIKSPRPADRAYAPPQPPIILTPPQPYPSMPSANPYSAAQQVVPSAPSARREFTTIGEEELAYHESEPVW